MASEQHLIFDRAFLYHYGMYHGILGSLELVLCYAITELLKVSPETGHVVTSGMELGRKLTLLRNVAYRSDHPQKRRIMSVAGTIQNESKRNVFAHSYITSEKDTVTFVERSRGGDYRVVKHIYTLKEFVAHVQNFVKCASELETLLGITPDKLRQFGEAAFKAETNETKSPTPPIESAE